VARQYPRTTVSKPLNTPLSDYDGEQPIGRIIMATTTPTQLAMCRCPQGRRRWTTGPT
jgi:hypothetical protein